MDVATTHSRVERSRYAIRTPHFTQHGLETRKPRNRYGVNKGYIYIYIYIIYQCADLPPHKTLVWVGGGGTIYIYIYIYFFS